MSLNDVVSGERTHIAFFGRRNAGKSSLVNAVTGQNISIVSDVAGTTTDAVKKSMELLPIGPVTIIDTPGIDDDGSLGTLRVEAAKRILNQTDIAVLVVDGTIPIGSAENDLIDIFKSRDIPFIVVYTKSDIVINPVSINGENEISVSSYTGDKIFEFKEKLGKLAEKTEKEKKLIGDLLNPGDIVVLVIPIDKAAPKGRLILPQQQVMRDILDSGCSFVACQPENLRDILDNTNVKPKIVVTDSQVFERVAEIVPDEIILTSFSILFARYKGNLDNLLSGAYKLDDLKDGDTVLISEGCTHHRQCGDIGTEKMPRWVKQYSGRELNFRFSSGGDFPDNLEDIDLVIHCGGCMLNEQQMKSRMSIAKSKNVPILNYGMAIAKMHGILDRSLKPFE